MSEISARLQQFKRANPTPRPRAVATRAPAPAPADGPPERAPPEGEAEAAADAEAAAVIQQAKGILSNGSASRASASLRRRPAAAAAASAQPAGPTTVELVKDAGGFGVEYTVAADGTLVVVSCAGGDAAPAPGAEILAVGGVDVKADADALRKALDSVRSTVMDGEMVAWVFAPRTDAAAGDSEDVRLAESMAAHLARPRAAARADSGVKPPAGGAEATVFRGRTELRREWKHNAVWDIESGLWASPFFGAFTAIRFFSLVLLAQLLLVFCCVFTEDGLAFPGWIVFSLAVATVSTGFPGWWEPMTNKHLRLHMIISAASAIVTVALSIVLRDQYATQSAGQRAKLSSLHIGIAAFQMLGCLFAFRTQAHALQVDEYIRARLEEELHARRRALALHSLPFQQTGEQGAESDVRDGLLWALDSHEGHFAPDEESSDIFDPDLRRLDIRLRQSTSRSDDMQQKNALLAQILRDNESHNRQQQAEMARLTETALDAQTMCERATARVNYFEQQLKLLTANDRRGAEASRP